MRKNKNLHNARNNKNDEFYTGLSDIEKELGHYEAHFKGKAVYCNCDDPRISNFFHYFSHNFDRLGLKRLIGSCYKSRTPDIFGLGDSESAVYLDYHGTKNDNGVPDRDDIGIRHLAGDGDFRNKESIALLEQADIVVTNPPFSLFREYMAQLIDYDKKFLIIGNQNAVCYKEIFPLLKENKVWLGHRYGGMDFHVPDHNSVPNDRLGTKTQSFGNICWFTNLENDKKNERLPLFRLYNETDYPKYDNYDAINVDRVNDIPVDYTGPMGVPITFMNKHNPDQFEIIGQGQGNLYRELTSKGLSQKFVDDYYKTDGKGSIKEDHPVLGYYDKRGKAVIPYMRIIIKHKKP